MLNNIKISDFIVFYSKYKYLLSKIIRINSSKAIKLLYFQIKNLPLKIEYIEYIYTYFSSIKINTLNLNYKKRGYVHYVKK